MLRGCTARLVETPLMEAAVLPMCASVTKLGTPRLLTYESRKTVRGPLAVFSEVEVVTESHALLAYVGDSNHGSPPPRTV